MLPTNKPYDDSVAQPPFYNPPEPQYDCASGCGYAAWEPGELHACIVCQKRFCKDCLVSLGGELFCQEHARCACGQPGIDTCVDCGAVKCGTCLVKDQDFCEVCK